MSNYDKENKMQCLVSSPFRRVLVTLVVNRSTTI